MRLAGERRGRSKGASGLTVLEVTIAMTIMTTVLLGSAGALLSSLSAVNAARRTSRGKVFLETVMEDLAAQPYTALPTFNGNKVYDKGNANASNFSVDLTVFLSAPNLQQVQAVLTDLRSKRVVGRLTTLRSSR
jgi:Tfp pilus assembly protein PilV